ncbi:MarR family transcriptional regulator [Alicyclobacillus cycloheptanicus]|uniref:DNA-binding MarR family transcriptional regulator n=1 Tax=Alicyclobacillus cycloheptanicus TaxID=1457 RepID=A0ABT9XD40_9BACL|nr:MarR family transcriptional regulator [Alicyclobacillus cycloheptanicus]MDQ0188213.1 DNA-binding MarR family transcriptional regulator [Alicyclobacillus cycloheptanicus]WDM00943.1 MarR family transcriptional regulator [Alicyclobacillus cycloheptanicus]
MESNDPVSVQMRQLDDLMARLQRMMAHDSLIKRSNMTASQIFILRYLDKCERAKASDIAKVAGLSPGAVTQVCDELERSGLVERIRSQEDRRVVYVSITAQGRQRLDEFRKIRSARMKKIFREIGAHDTGEFIRIVGRLVDLIERGVGEEADDAE